VVVGERGLTNNVLEGFVKGNVLVLGAIMVLGFLYGCYMEKGNVISQERAERFNGICIYPVIGYKYNSYGTKYSETVLTY